MNAAKMGKMGKDSCWVRTKILTLHNWFSTPFFLQVLSGMKQVHSNFTSNALEWW